MGSFRPGAGNQHLHWYFNFTGCIVETALKSLRLSCGSELTRHFRPGAGNQHLHWYFNFTGCIVETALKSLRLSCGSELTRQGISLP